MTYTAWISLEVLRHRGDVTGKCEAITAAMVAAFPELKRVRGHYFCSIWGQRAHWWCEAPDGTIIDPTSSQFPSKDETAPRGFGVYVPWKEGEEEPTGKCQNCLDYTYGGATFCSDTCEAEAIAELNRGAQE